MDQFIFENDLIAKALDYANDKDYGWEYDDPESFADFAEEQLYELIDKRMRSLGYSCDDPEALISAKVSSILYEEATSGDFDV